MSLTIAKINGDLTTYNDTAFINQNRKLFIASSMNEDTLIRPLPAIPKKINAIKFWNKK